MKICKNCGTEIRDEDRICYRCGTEYVEEESVTEEKTDTADPKAYKLKWHKTFIALLLISGIIRIILSVQAITGRNVYRYNGADATALINMLYPGIKELNIIYGIVGLLTAILMYCVGFWLIKYKKTALKWLSVLSLVWVVGRVLYVGAASLVSKVNLFEDTTIISAIIGYTVLGVINWVYYSKRKEMFVK